MKIFDYQPTYTEADSSSLKKALLLYMTVIIGGGAVMILELLGTRIIAPFYGASLYVWSSLISVTLIALALGYYLGGFLVDRYPSFRLGHVLLLAALSTVIIPFISSSVLNFTNPLGIRGGGFCSAFILFSLPLTLLAMIGPFAIKQATQDLTGLGQTVGSIYAVSTAGSVFATLLLGFYLLPHFGTRSILLHLSVFLLCLGLLLIYLQKPEQTSMPSSIGVVCLTLLIISLAGQGYAYATTKVKGMTILSETESIYGWVRVLDDEKNGFRLLLSDASMLSAIEKLSERSLLSYQKILSVLPAVRPKVNSALLIGLGGGHVAKYLNSTGIPTDTIEIDPAVAEAAKTYFNFKPVGAFIVGDARAEIKQLNKQYDYIMHDCFTGGAEPTHLLTQEMLTELKGLLTEQGILALNYVGFRSGEGADAVDSVYKTLQTVFPFIKVFVTEKADFTDFIFTASQQPIMLNSKQPDQRLQWLSTLEYRPPLGNGIIITDDFNPMESKQVRKAELYRQVFIDRMGYDLLFH